jgi:hypothetical protein
MYANVEERDDKFAFIKKKLESIVVLYPRKADKNYSKQECSFLFSNYIRYCNDLKMKLVNK